MAVAVVVLHGADVDAPRRQVARAASTSATTSWSPLIEPGAMSERPFPIVIEQPEPVA
jgi:hypothetical protein